jgi:outer membrane protein assembly factor BamB
MSNPHMVSRTVLLALTLAATYLPFCMTGAANAADWPRFRGPNGSGVSPDAQATPIKWSEADNLQWSVDLPGQGVSCPIVVSDRVFVTSWTGTGPDDLVRHLVCYDRATGKQVFDKSIKPVVKDEPYEGMFTQTGYTASTPACDGKGIYCFFGVSGLYAFNMDGDELWHTSVGTNFDERRWGTASSPVPCGDLVIVTAAAESKSIVALNKSDGKEAWRFDSPVLAGTWSTPLVVDLPEGKQELVFSVPGYLWAFDPKTGKQNWTCKGSDSNSACGSAIAQDGIIYAIGGREGGGIAVRAGGSGDVTETHVLWTGSQRARIGTPVIQDGLIYWVADGIANCIEAETGAKVYQERLTGQDVASHSPSVFQFVAQETTAAGSPPAQSAESGTAQAAAGEENGGEQRGDAGQAGEGRRRGRGRGGRGGDWFRSQDYASPIIADGKMYFTRRAGEVVVIGLGRDYEQLAINKFSGEADYSATPAIADGQIFIRSSKKLYCVAEE